MPGAGAAAVGAIVVAAGRGDRFGAPKQFLELAGTRLVDHAVGREDQHLGIGRRGPGAAASIGRAIAHAAFRFAKCGMTRSANRRIDFMVAA